jgi:hexokinase
MASLFALQFKDAQEVFDLIDHQFSISNDVLVELTKAFLDEFKTGLSTYNQPMAMM